MFTQMLLRLHQQHQMESAWSTNSFLANPGTESIALLLYLSHVKQLSLKILNTLNEISLRHLNVWSQASLINVAAAVSIFQVSTFTPSLKITVISLWVLLIVSTKKEMSYYDFTKLYGTTSKAKFWCDYMTGLKGQLHAIDGPKSPPTPSVWSRWLLNH